MWERGLRAPDTDHDHFVEAHDKAALATWKADQILRILAGAAGKEREPLVQDASAIVKLLVLICEPSGQMPVHANET